jgi:hypothetical protein
MSQGQKGSWKQNLLDTLAQELQAGHSPADVAAAALDDSSPADQHLDHRGTGDPGQPAHAPDQVGSLITLCRSRMN